LFGSIGVILGLFTIWVISKFDKPYVSSLKEVNEGQHKVSSNLFDCLSNIVSVITLRLEKSMETGLMNKVANIYPAFKRTVTINEWKWFATQMLVSLIYVIITLGYVYQNWVPGEVFYIGGLITMLGFVMQFTSVFDDIASQYTQVLQYHTDVQTASVIFEEYDKQNRPQGIIPLSTHWENIYIKNLNFVHPEILSDKKRTNGLYDLSMNINRGKKIALIGESGSGKSTLLSLLRGLYQAEPGISVNVDGHEGYALSNIADTVTLFSQEPEIFENTIGYNITLGLPFSDEEVIEVCEIAQFTEVIKKLPDGLKTQIMENGVNLSGGQKQRLALARGILAARIVVLILKLKYSYIIIYSRPLKEK
jgi:ABC-type bacteriocin/lantibiotic exporter with double-glycine peptidase domain